MATSTGPTPTRILNSVAPIRVCDNGGWTDTWFAGHGQIFNIAVAPFAEAQIRVYPADARQKRITIHAEDYGERYSIDPPRGLYDKHPLLEAAFDYLELPEAIAVDVTVHCDAPAGCSTGTSAAVSVALIGALDLLRGARLTAHEVAEAAQLLETKFLGQQCGIQDQLASAHGGIHLFEMHAYPHATAHRVAVTDQNWWELESRLALLYVGDSHSSSRVHEMVIRGLENEGPTSPKLAPLRTTALASKAALEAGDFRALGQAMIDNTEGQRSLHAELIGPHHQRIIDIAAAHGAEGWKVNGAGGDGGSVTLLAGPDRAERRAMLKAILADNPRYQAIPIRLARQGLRRWESNI